MIMVAVGGLLLACMAAIANWRLGILLTIFVALLQDPVRKLVPEQPAYFILFTGIVFGAALLGALRSNIPISLNTIAGWPRYIGRAFLIYALVVIAQAAHSLVRYGNPLVPTLGLISYFAPFVALSLAYAFAIKTGTRGIHRYFLTYAVCAAIALTTVYFESSGMDLPIFGEVGQGIVIYDQYQGKLLVAHSGIFRASEIAAWHAAMSACVLILLLTMRRFVPSRVILAVAIAAIIVGLGILTGRRKFIVMIVIFAAVYVGLLGLVWSRSRTLTLTALLVGAISYCVFFLAAEPDVQQTRQTTYVASREYEVFVKRTSSVFGDVNKRFLELGLAPLLWSYDQFGLMGGGVGIGTQGVEQLTEVKENIGAAEGGLGKIMLELGIFGLLAVASLFWALSRHIYAIVNHSRRQSPELSRLACGLSALLVANMASFSVATQAFGDVFILLFLGICLGTLLAIPRLGEYAPRAQTKKVRVLRARSFDRDPRANETV